MRVGLLTREYPPAVYGGAGVHVEFLARELRKLDRGRRPLHGRRAPRRDRSFRARSAPRRGQRRAAGAVGRPGDGGGRRRRRPRPLAHVVRQHGGSPGQAAVRHPPRRHVALAGAGSAMEGGAARWRLSALVVGRADRLRGGRCRHCRERRAPSAMSWPRTRRSTLLASTSSTTGSTPTCIVPSPRPTCSSGSGSTPIDHRWCSSAASPARRACPTCCGRRSTSTRPPRWCCWPAPPTRPSWRPRRWPRSSGYGPSATRSSGSKRCSRSSRSARCCLTPPSSCARRSTNRWGSSISRRWRARPAVVASDVGGIPEVVDDGVTGLLVHYDETEPAAFEAALASRVNELVGDPAARGRHGRAGRARALAEFGWDTAARRTVEIYEAVADLSRRTLHVPPRGISSASCTSRPSPCPG